ncbi:glutamate racemase [Aliikangiella sp. IMCC44632]
MSSQLHQQSERQAHSPIGIFDSGVGGLSVLNAINQLLPKENLIYLADTQYTPYGEKSEEQIKQRVLKIAQFLIQKKVKMLVVACNTATAAAVNNLRETYTIPIVGLEPALKPAILFSEKETVGVLATRSTLESEKYKTLKARFEGQADIIEKASSLFVEMVETAPLIGARQQALIKAELQPFIKANVASLVLGCTHYPFLTEAISRIMGPKVKLFESAQPVANEVKRRLETNLNSQQSNGAIEFFSSAPEKAQQSFERLLKRQVNINSF